MEQILSSRQTWTVTTVVLSAVLLGSSIMERRRLANMAKLLRVARLAIDRAAAEEAALQEKIVSLEARVAQVDADRLAERAGRTKAEKV
mgnify:CR=1 FL=1